MSYNGAHTVYPFKESIFKLTIFGNFNFEIIFLNLKVFVFNGSPMTTAADLAPV